jgi:ubiquinone/menaquinone biosynthesis C-methylase UbiE
MTKAQSKIYRLLDSPHVYSLAQIIIAPGMKKLRGAAFDKLLQNSTEKKILDVGCGPEVTNSFTNKGLLVGVDINYAYIEHYTRRRLEHECAILGIIGSAENLPFEDNFFDESRCVSLFHHLSDDMVKAAINEMFRCLKPGGRMFIFDLVWPRNPFSKPVGWLLTYLDRGEFVRSKKELILLIQSSCAGQWQSSRITHTYYGHEGVICTTQKL